MTTDRVNPIARILQGPEYFREIDGEVQSRAQMVMEAFAEGAADATLAKEAQRALTDFLIAQELLCDADDEDSMQCLSEAVLSAIALGLRLAGTARSEELGRALEARHQYNRERKAEALKWCRDQSFETKKAAINAIAEKFCVSPDTVKDWPIEIKKTGESEKKRNE